jgi:hypothetical protein
MDGDYTSWHVGMKVVCVCADCVPGLKSGAVYTIRKIGRDEELIHLYGDVDIWLVETARPGGNGYGVNRFRPVQTRKTDISMFTAMLRPIDAKLKETV